VDLACGRGGDLDKWASQLGPKGFVLGLDISTISVREAKARCDHHREPTTLPQCHFLRGDFADPLLWSWLDQTKSPGRIPQVDCVTCHFALHYAWSEETRAKIFLENAAVRLREGGRFICTIVNVEELARRIQRNLRGGERGVVIRNPLYKILVDDGEAFLRDSRGDSFAALPYEFSLEGAIDECEEFGVVPRWLVRWGADAGLRVVDGPVSFRDILRWEDKEGKEAMWNALGDSQREICELYSGWIFEKMAAK
jgi:mRNA (guanine-N7-)-methyltransferase